MQRSRRWDSGYRRNNDRRAFLPRRDVFPNVVEFKYRCLYRKNDRLHRESLILRGFVWLLACYIFSNRIRFQMQRRHCQKRSSSRFFVRRAHATCRIYSMQIFVAVGNNDKLFRRVIVGGAWRHLHWIGHNPFEVEMEHCLNGRRKTENGKTEGEVALSLRGVASMMVPLKLTSGRIWNRISLSVKSVIRRKISTSSHSVRKAKRI